MSSQRRGGIVVISHNLWVLFPRHRQILGGSNTHSGVAAEDRLLLWKGWIDGWMDYGGHIIEAAREREY